MPTPPVFMTPLVFEDDGVMPFVLFSPLVYRSVLIGELVVPQGFHTDLASIPRPLWSLLPPIGRYDAAAVVHDWLYAQGTTTRAQADRVLREAMTATNTGIVVRWLIYLAVRLGGAPSWDRHRHQHDPPDGE